MRNRIVLLALCAGLVSGGFAFAQDGDKTITFWHHTYTVATDWMREQAAKYLEDHPGLQIDIIEYPHGDYEVRLRAAIAAGDPPDILNVLDYLFPEFYEKGWLAPVDPGAFGVSTQQDVVDLFVHPALEGMVFDEQVYGVPAEFNTFVLFLNQEMFAEAGLDASALSAQWQERAATWDEFFDLLSSVEMRNADGAIERIGFNWVWGLDSFWYAQQFLERHHPVRLRRHRRRQPGGDRLAGLCRGVRGHLEPADHRGARRPRHRNRQPGLRLPGLHGRAPGGSHGRSLGAGGVAGEFPQRVRELRGGADSAARP